MPYLIPYPLQVRARDRDGRRFAAPRLPLLHFCGDQREFFIDNLLVRIHYIIVMIRWTGLAPWEFEFPFPGSLTSTFLFGDQVRARDRDGRFPSAAGLPLLHLRRSLAHRRPVAV